MNIAQAPSAPSREEAAAVGGDIPGFASYDAAVDAEALHDIEDPVLGTQMMYTSGATGYPKGVLHREAAPVSPLFPARIGRSGSRAPVSSERFQVKCLL